MTHTRHLSGAAWSTPRDSPVIELPVLKFTPYAWAKLLCLRDLGDTEIGGFGIADADDPLLIEDFALVQQRCTAVSVEFDDEAVADFFDRQVDLGRQPECFGRIWLHTHPGSSATPSDVDEATFARVFGLAHWSVMFILAKGGATYTRLAHRGGPHVSLEIPCEVDYKQPFPATDHDAWEQEYAACVRSQELPRISRTPGTRTVLDEHGLHEEPLELHCDYTDEPCESSGCGWCAACQQWEKVYCR